MPFLRPRPDRLAILVRISTEAWLQSRAALYMAVGNEPSLAATKARAAFAAAFGDAGIDVTYFTLERIKE